MLLLFITKLRIEKKIMKTGSEKSKIILNNGFATPEHEEAGNEITLSFIKDGGVITLSKGQKLPIFADEGDTPIEITSLSLSYGEILALAGDYFACKQSIAMAPTNEEAKARFVEGFNQLASTRSDIITSLFRINSTRYAKDASINEYIQQALFVKLLGWRYFEITNNNFDHFYEWSITAYQQGHHVALEMAQKGYELYQAGDEFSANNYLSTAYQLNAFACHFLSDTFSSGHLRESSLRSQLSTQFGILGSILVNNMHDEDSQQGVSVSNLNGDSWMAYGDGNYDNPRNERNRIIQNTALQQSANEVFTTYRTGLMTNPADSLVNNYLPIVAETKTQNAPMFKSMSNKVYYRNPLNELNPSKVVYKELGYFSAFVIAFKLRVLNTKPTYTLSTATPAPLPGLGTSYLLKKIKSAIGSEPQIKPASTYNFTQLTRQQLSKKDHNESAIELEATTAPSLSYGTFTNK